MPPNEIAINFVPGNVAPRYDTGSEVECVGITITEQGTQSRLPLVDFKMRAPNGEQFVLVLTGRIVNMISAAVKGANMRNHGKQEP